MLTIGLSSLARAGWIDETSAPARRVVAISDAKIGWTPSFEEDLDTRKRPPAWWRMAERHRIGGSYGNLSAPFALADMYAYDGGVDPGILTVDEELLERVEVAFADFGIEMPDDLRATFESMAFSP